jgi:hypothetical protein
MLCYARRAHRLYSLPMPPIGWEEHVAKLRRILERNHLAPEGTAYIGGGREERLDVPCELIQAGFRS